MAFAFPWRYAHESTRYPITVAMRDTVTMPQLYQLIKMLADRDTSATDKT